MIQPIIAAQTSSPVASIQQNHDAQSVLQSHNAGQNVQKQEERVRESVVKKDEAVFYEQNHDAKEEGRNKYVNLYTKKKKNKDKNDLSASLPEVNRVNFDIKM